MKDLIKLVLTLTGVAFIAGVLLAFTQQFTKEPIRLAEQRELFESLARVLPPGDGDPRPVTISNAAGSATTFYLAVKGGALAGVAFSSASPNGYGGPVGALIGLTADGTVNGVEIRQSETPGLGTKITEPAFKSQLPGKPLEGSVWKVKKDGGPIDAVSGATISSRAICEAMAAAVATYTENKAAIQAAAAKETP